MAFILDYKCDKCGVEQTNHSIIDGLTAKSGMICICGGVFESNNGFSQKGWLNHYDMGLGATITSPGQKSRLMKKLKVVDASGVKSKNPLVEAAKDKWKWRRKNGLA